MLAAHRDQENMVHSHHQMTAKPGSRHLPPKTPGARYPNTPLKVPLNDENATHVTGGKAIVGAQSKAVNQNTIAKRQGLATPHETRQRAPLGNKTTNAKARTGQTVGVKDIVRDFEQTQTQAKQTTVQRSKLKPAGVAPIKFDVRSDKQESDELDIEYAPPKPKDLPYESDVFPAGVLTFEGLKKENLMRGYYERYHDPVDENGVRLKDKQFEELKAKALKAGDERILRDIENTDWSVSDVPETKTLKKISSATAPTEASKTARLGSKYPPTVASRKAVSALSMSSTLKKKNVRAPLAQAPQATKPASFLPSLKKVTKPSEPTKSGPDAALGEAASRNTIGYTKGRSASSIVKSRGTLSRTASGTSISSDHSDSTITPSNAHLESEPTRSGAEEWPRPQFLNIFDINEDSDDEYLGGSIDLDAEEEEFELRLGD